MKLKTPQIIPERLTLQHTGALTKDGSTAVGGTAWGAGFQSTQANTRNAPPRITHDEKLYG